MSQEDEGGGGDSTISLQRWLDPQSSLSWGACGVAPRSLGRTNGSFSSPRKMDVDTVWQWSMRLWFLIIAGEEADGCGLSGWERAENGGRFTTNHLVPSDSALTFDPAGTMTRILPWWFISSFPPKTPSTPPPTTVCTQKHMPVAMETGLGGTGKDVFGPVAGSGSKDESLTLPGKKSDTRGWYLTLRVEPMDGIDICIDWGGGSGLITRQRKLTGNGLEVQLKAALHVQRQGRKQSWQ